MHEKIKKGTHMITLSYKCIKCIFRETMCRCAKDFDYKRSKMRLLFLYIADPLL